MGGGLGRVVKHPDYYLSDGSVSFLTEGTLFRVHRSFFERESEVFRNLFVEAAQDDPQSGTDARPFTLTDVTPEEFSQLLWVWYDKEYSYRQQSKENWLIILRLATRWGFDRIRELTIRELESLELPPAERISIYNEYGIEGEGLLSSYVELCKSPTVPTEAEGHLLRMESLINVLQARENAQRKAVKMGHGSPTSASLEDQDLREVVSEFFKGLTPQSSGIATGSGDQAPKLNGVSSTITVAKPQIPNRGNPQLSHVNDGPQAGGGKGKERDDGEDARDVTKLGDEDTKRTTAAQNKDKGESDEQKTESEKVEKAEKENVEKEKTKSSQPRNNRRR